MRVTLLHNPTAGREEHSKEKLKRALCDAGHKVTYRSTKSRDWKNVLDKPADLIVAAGGDGTIGKVARQLIGRKVPLSVLPLGTANNLARTLGFDQPVAKLIERIGKGEPRGFDVGLARGPWGRRYFFEGVGAGLLAEYLRLPKERKRNHLPKEEEMKRHVARLRDLLSKYRARKWKLKLEDDGLTDRYLLFEAMNICSIGPVLNLAPDAKTNDGHLDLVLATESDRTTLLDYLTARLKDNQEAEFPLPARTFKRLRIKWSKSPLHLDDELWPEEDDARLKPDEIEISVKKSALMVLWP